MNPTTTTTDLPTDTDTSHSAIVITNVSKRFGTVQALNQVCFEVSAGQVFSILGPNGAGKTTLLNILMTMTQPDSGTATILGWDILKNPMAIRAHIGVVSQDNHFETYFSIWDNLRLHAELHGLPPHTYKPRIETLLKQVLLWERRFDKASQLSGGMQRKVALIRALIHEPKLLFLDEPTTGLDPMARRQIWETIQTLKSKTTVVLTTHYMEEADLLSDTILMLNHGQVVMQGSPRTLKQSISPQNRFALDFKTPTAHQYYSTIAALPETQAAHCELKLINDYRLEFCLPEGISTQPMLAVVSTQDFHRLGLLESNLEDVFMAVANQKPSASGPVQEAE